MRLQTLTRCDSFSVEPRRFVDRPYLPANYGKGIVGLYHSSMFNDLRINQALETDKMPTIALKSPDIISGRKSNASGIYDLLECIWSKYRDRKVKQKCGTLK